MDYFTKARVTGLVRHLLTFGGGWMVATGLIDEATSIELVGAGVTIFGALWSFFAPEKVD